MTKKMVVSTIVVLVLTLGGSYQAIPIRFLPTPIAEFKKTSDEENSNSPDDFAMQQAEVIRQLTRSPVASTTRSFFDLLSATTTEARQQLLSAPLFQQIAAEKLDKDRLQSKFLVLGGHEIPSVGAQIFILFPDFPDVVFRAGYQITGDQNIPFRLVDFTLADDKPEDIRLLLERLQNHLNGIGA
jgi:hypothetical protein